MLLGDFRNPLAGDLRNLLFGRRGHAPFRHLADVLPRELRRDMLLGDFRNPLAGDLSNLLFGRRGHAPFRHLADVLSRELRGDVLLRDFRDPSTGDFRDLLFGRRVHALLRELAHPLSGDLGDHLFGDLADPLLGNLGHLLSGDRPDSLLGDLSDSLFGNFADPLFGDLADSLVRHTGFTDRFLDNGIGGFHLDVHHGAIRLDLEHDRLVLILVWNARGFRLERERRRGLDLEHRRLRRLLGYSRQRGLDRDLVHVVLRRLLRCDLDDRFGWRHGGDWRHDGISLGVRGLGLGGSRRNFRDLRAPAHFDPDVIAAARGRDDEPLPGVPGRVDLLLDGAQIIERVTLLGDSICPSMPRTASVVSGRDDSSTCPHASGPRNESIDAEFSTTYGFSPACMISASPSRRMIASRSESRRVTCRLCFGPEGTPHYPTS